MWRATEEHLVHAMILSISVWHLFNDELDIENSETILISQRTWESVLAGDTPVTGIFEVKVQPLADGTPHKGTAPRNASLM